jgi:nucleolar MIF4G domain-containing protein 1
MVMSGLIPLYIGAIAGVHWLGGDGIMLGGCLVEWSVLELFHSLKKGREVESTAFKANDENESTHKETSNILLIVCYLYNYGVIHCSLIYDLVRDFIQNFTEIDIEALLIILSHCGQQLRSDDPSALKDIVILVKDRAQKVADANSSHENGDIGGGGGVDSSRVEFMVDSIIELRNNKPRKQDVIIREKTNVLKKSIGRIKSSASRLLAGKKSGSCLRLTLRDVLDADTKGRWWMIGASWAGNQHNDLLFGDADAREPDEVCNEVKAASFNGESDEDELLALASSQRMNTDARRSIFCIIMGSSDFDDAFEKLVRQGMLKPKVERDVIRVIVHCCGEEEAFNPFYAYLAIRCCEFQPKSRFTLMLTFWDVFKQVETFSERKVANLAKLLAYLVGGNSKCLTIGVLKRIDFSPTSMPEMVIIFLSIFMSSLFESNTEENTRMIFSRGIAPSEVSETGKAKSKRSNDDDDDTDDDDDSACASRGKTRKEDLSELHENLSVFLLQYMKASPKNVKGSQFHSNLMAAIST